jgi:hypothetical protein
VAGTLAGSVRMRDAPPRHTQAQRMEMFQIIAHLFLRQDRKRKADHQKISLNVLHVPRVVHGNVAHCAIFFFLKASVQVVSAANDDGESLSNRKRVPCSFISRFMKLPWLTRRVVECSQVHRYPHPRKIRRNRKCRVRRS